MITKIEIYDDCNEQIESYYTIGEISEKQVVEIVDKLKEINDKIDIRDDKLYHIIDEYNKNNDIKLIEFDNTVLISSYCDYKTDKYIIEYDGIYR